MMNPIWLFLLCGGIAAALVGEQETAVFPALLEGATAAVELAIGLVAFLSLWCGIMRLAEKSGLLEICSRCLRPLLRPLFPTLSREHKAWAPMAMNLSANLLGLGNAATPFGIKAMAELAKTNPEPGTASAEMITFMALNTSAVSLVPGMIIGLRADAGSLNATEIIVPSLLASLCGLLAALIAAKLLAKRES